MKTKNNTREISFSCTYEEFKLITKIVDRIGTIHSMKQYDARDRASWEMDLLAVHANGRELNFKRLLGFDTFNFVHDITGIMHNLNRTTGKLEGTFLPRCVKRSDDMFSTEEND